MGDTNEAGVQQRVLKRDCVSDTLVSQTSSSELYVKKRHKITLEEEIAQKSVSFTLCYKSLDDAEIMLKRDNCQCHIDANHRQVCVIDQTNTTLLTSLRRLKFKV